MRNYYLTRAEPSERNPGLLKFGYLNISLKFIVSFTVSNRMNFDKNAFPMTSNNTDIRS